MDSWCGRSMSAAGAAPRSPVRAGRSQGPKGAPASAGGGRRALLRNVGRWQGGRMESRPPGGSAAAALAVEAASVGDHTSAAAARSSAVFGGPLAVARFFAARRAGARRSIATRAPTPGAGCGRGLRVARDQLDLRAFAQLVRTVDDDHVTRRKSA